MANVHSYGATLKNNDTESEAIRFLLEKNPCFNRPSKDERREILNSLGLPPSFSRAFDLVLSPNDSVDKISEIPLEKLILIELKTTKKKLTNNPDGFFFGATENEFRLAEKLGDKFKFCFVSLHPDSSTYVLLSLKDLKKKIRTQRIQYQINL